jgi:hypothetical protein
MSLIESQSGMTDLIPCNEGCGGNYETYDFTQSDSEVVVHIPVPQGTSSKNVVVEMSTYKILIAMRGVTDHPILAGTFYKPVKAEDSTWTIEDKKLLVVTIAKSNLQYEEWWPHVTTSERQIDIKTLKPPSKHLRELDEGTQATVTKMMFDQEQKRRGLPTSDEKKMAELMKHAPHT